ncbi:lipase/esterase family protein [Cryptococcus neoformans Bt85]|nr:lipase/esterase family protein [Cryptococcus neoformans var. grubii Bt85]
MTGFGTPSVAVAATPTVISTFFSHVLAHRRRKSASKKSLEAGGPGGGPEDQLTYEEGLQVVRRFLDFASHHGVEEVQAFTAMWVPTPRWVRRDVMVIPDENIKEAEDILAKHLSTYGPQGAEGGGLQLVGGDKWWRVRRRTLEGEWIEMQQDYIKRTAKKAAAESTAAATLTSPTSLTDTNRSNTRYMPRKRATTGSVMDNAGGEVVGDRVIMYIHGGAFFFSSLETHRYQVQRHVRKAGARAFCPAYRLSPQYPFPCGLLDCLAAYLYLISPPPSVPHQPILPTNIILSGDSAGAGMVISLLVLIREMGLPMPAGASLISPWVDLTHSMPSIGGWDGGDFIPSSGFHYKPSCAWPPLPGDGIDVTMPDGSVNRYDEQIQMYCPNNLLTHPLVSPVNQGSLGGLCPLLILGGGGELLRDEITYTAYKAADPVKYPPSPITLSQYPDQASKVAKYKPTKVHLQIYEGGCHVVPTLSWTKSAKYMYRACANFNIWAFTAAQKALEKKLQHKQSSSSLRKQRSASSLNKPYNVTKLPNGLSPLSMSDSLTNGMTHSSHSPTTPGVINASGARSPLTASSATSRQSTIDFTQPIITSGAAVAANTKPISFGEVQSEAESDEDDMSVTSESTIADEEERGDPVPAKAIVTVHGTEPLYGNVNLVSERVSVHGNIRPFEPIEAVPALQPSLREHIGQVHGDGAIRKWLARRHEWDKKYSKELAKWREIKQKDRIKAEAEGFLTRDLQDERPPLCSVAGIWDKGLARNVAKSVDEVTSRSMGMGWWTKWGSKADEEHADRRKMREKAAREEEQSKLHSAKDQGVPNAIPPGPMATSDPPMGGAAGTEQLFDEPEAILFEDAEGERNGVETAGGV